MRGGHGGGGRRGGGGFARPRPYPVYYGNPYIYPPVVTTLVDTESMDKGGGSQMVSYRNHNIELKGNGIIIYNSNGTQVMMKSPGTVEEGKKMIDDMLKKSSYDGYMTTGVVGEFKVTYMPRSANGKIVESVMADNLDEAKVKAKELRANNNSVLIMKNVKNDKGLYSWEILPLEDYNNDKVNKWIIISLCAIIFVLCIIILRNKKIL